MRPVLSTISLRGTVTMTLLGTLSNFVFVYQLWVRVNQHRQSEVQVSKEQFSQIIDINRTPTSAQKCSPGDIIFVYAPLLFLIIVPRSQRVDSITITNNYTLYRLEINPLLLYFRHILLHVLRLYKLWTQKQLNRTFFMNYCKSNFTSWR